MTESFPDDERDPEEDARSAQARFAETLERVAARGSIGDEECTELSHLAGSRLDAFRQVWQQLTEPDRLALLRRLRTREEDDLRLEFNSVYHLAIEDESPEIQTAGIESIVEDKSDWLMDRLMRLAEKGDHTGLRAAAARALGPFAAGVELGEWPEEDADALEALLLLLVRRDREAIELRGAALESLGYLNQSDVYTEIEMCFRDDELRLSAIRAMGHSGEPRWLSRLLGAVSDEDSRVRLAVARSCGEIPDTASVPALVDLLDDEAIEVRLAAIAALAELGGDEAREGLFYAVEDKRAEVREAASLALAELDFYEDPLSL